MKRAHGELLAQLVTKESGTSQVFVLGEGINTHTPTPSPTPEIPTQTPTPAKKIPQKVQSDLPKTKPLINDPSANSAALKAAGIPEDQWAAADWIIVREGNYQPCIRNGGAIDCTYPLDHENRKSYGVCQALPGHKMASAGDDWATNLVTQLKWCNSYAQARYGGWNQAKIAWQKQHWW